jgi:hypothetical protein
MKKFMAVAGLVLVLFVSACIGSNSNQGGGTAQQAGGEQGGQQGVAQEANQQTTQPQGGQQSSQQHGSQAVSTTLVQASGGGITDQLSNIASAVTSGLAYTCTFTYEGNKTEMLVKGEKSKLQMDSGEGVINELSDGTWIYIWTEGSDTGMKMNIQQTKSASNQPNAQNTGQTDMKDIEQSAVDVKCVPSTASDAAFNPPATVQFTDLSSLAQLGATGGDTGAGAGTDYCSVCSMIQDAQQKQECLNSCNGA